MTCHGSSATAPRAGAAPRATRRSTSATPTRASTAASATTSSAPTSASASQATPATTARSTSTTAPTVPARTEARVSTGSMTSSASASLRLTGRLVKERWIPALPTPAPMAPRAHLTETIRSSPARVPSGIKEPGVRSTLTSAPPPDPVATEPRVSTLTAATRASVRVATRAGTVC